MAESNITSNNEKLKKSTKSQILENVTLDKFDGVQQKIDLSKIGIEKSQTFTLLDLPESEELLLGVLSGGIPVASFTRGEDGKIKLSLFAPFVEEIKKQNPNLVLPEVNLDEEKFLTYEIEKLKLSSNMTIEDIEIKSASTEFALMFSALTCQVKDKNGNLGRMQAENPLDIVASPRFLYEAMLESSGCSIDKKPSAAYDAILISKLQLERRKKNNVLSPDGNLNVDAAVESLSIKIPEDSATPEVELYSIPIKRNGEIDYLNIKKENGKTSAYLRITKEISKRSKPAPQFYDIEIAHLEADQTQNGQFEHSSLYLGLKNSRGDASRINLDIDFEENAESLSLIREVLTKPFAKETKLSHNERGISVGSTIINGQTFEVYPRPTEPSAFVASFDEVAILSKSEERKKENVIEPEPPSPPKDPEPQPPIKPEDPVGIIPIEPEPQPQTPVDPEPTVKPEEPQPQPVGPEEPAHNGRDDRDAAGAGDKTEKKPEEKEEKKEEQKDAPKKEKSKFINSGLYLGILGVVGILLPIFLPQLAIVGVAMISVGLVSALGLTQPWKTAQEIAKKMKENRKPRYRSLRTLERAKDKAEKALTKKENALQKQQNKLEQLKARRNQLEALDVLKPEDVKELKKLEKEISKQEKAIEKADLKRQEAQGRFNEADDVLQERNQKLNEIIANEQAQKVSADLEKRREKIDEIQRKQTEYERKTRDEVSRKTERADILKDEISQLRGQAQAKRQEILAKGDKATDAEKQELEAIEQKILDKTNRRDSLLYDIGQIDKNLAGYQDDIMMQQQEIADIYSSVGIETQPETSVEEVEETATPSVAEEVAEQVEEIAETAEEAVETKAEHELYVPPMEGFVEEEPKVEAEPVKAEEPPIKEEPVKEEAPKAEEPEKTEKPLTTEEAYKQMQEKFEEAERKLKAEKSADGKFEDFSLDNLDTSKNPTQKSPDKGMER